MLLLRDSDRARKLLMRGAGVTEGEPVGLPVNCRRRNSESVKRAGGIPRFVELKPDLEFDVESPGFDEVRV
ncbi:MAG: hypothetical protein IT335_03575, partial [Thermomicrobiales bacterium]|nr:hypothetical protein [Thermomicrobiales bacterium]